MRLTFHADADAEVTEAARYYERQVEDLGLAFSTSSTPRWRGSKLTRRPRLWLERSAQGDSAAFPYNVLYVVEPDRIRVIAVAHQKRRPNYWQGRL